MKTVSTKVYTIDELSEEAKAKAIDRWIAADDLPDLSDAMLEHLTEVLLPKYGMQCDDAKVYYSLSYSQGDGAMFEGTIRWKAWQVEVRQNGHYYHYNSKTFWNFESVKTGREPNDAQYNAFNDAYVAVCRELEKYGYDYIEYEHEPEHVIEEMQANECEFYANGDLYYER